MRKMMKARNGGFTLVELLIVIIIIAILAGMMLLSTGAATDTAEAAKIINDLRNLKGAALLYYVDHMEYPTQTKGLSSLDMYLDRPAINSSPPRYAAYTITGPVNISGVERILIGVTLNEAQNSTGIKRKLTERAPASGLFSVSGTAYGGEIDVYMSMK
jgi:general secretion pathway protein G